MTAFVVPTRANMGDHELTIKLARNELAALMERGGLRMRETAVAPGMNEALCAGAHMTCRGNQMARAAVGTAGRAAVPRTLAGGS